MRHNSNRHPNGFLVVLVLLLMLLVPVVVNVFGFSVPITTGRFSQSSVVSFTRKETTKSTTILFSEPSDTSSEDYSSKDYPGYGDDTTVVDVTTSDSTHKQDILVSNVFDLLPADTISTSTTITSEVRAAINEALYKLEGLYSASSLQGSSSDSTPTTSSPLLNGIWELRYFGGYTTEMALSSPTRELALFLYSGGYSPGMFALQIASSLGNNNPLLKIGQLEITISRIQPRIDASIPIELLNGLIKSSIQVTANLDIISSIRLKETYSTINIFSTTNIDIPKQLQYSRDLYITYIDNDLLILRDASGIPEVLVRKSKTFIKNWGIDPPDTDTSTIVSDDNTVVPSDVDNSIVDSDDDSASY